MAEVVLRALPTGVSREGLTQLLEEQRGQEELLRTVIRRFERRYDESLVALEARLARGEGREHPDWEDSIDWRNAVESLHRAQMMRTVLEWLLGSIVPSTAFIARCSYVKAIQNLVTKWRLELTYGYVFDVYYNETLGKYGYTLVLAGVRILGWDNAPHHPGLINFPHHVHRPDGQIEPSALTGDPEDDLEQVRRRIEAYLAEISQTEIRS